MQSITGNLRQLSMICETDNITTVHKEVAGHQIRYGSGTLRSKIRAKGCLIISECPSIHFHYLAESIDKIPISINNNIERFAVRNRTMSGVVT